MRWLLFASIVFLLSSCYVFKAYRFRKFDLNDLNKIDAVSLPNSTQPFAFAYDTMQHDDLKGYLDSNLKPSLSYAFLVIRNDSILYERYFGDVTPASMLPSFSAAKSVTSTLFAIAMGEGKIKNLTDPVTDYLPELQRHDSRWSKVTLQNVLDMRSGVKSNESYTNPFSDVLKLGFSRNVSKQALKSKIETPPGNFNYKSVNTQLLALVVERATGKKLQDYAIEKLWKPLQMEFSATWNDDKNETVRAFCCINAAARDYAKFGRLFLNEGVWQGQQIVPKAWIDQSTNSGVMLQYKGYKNQWWSQPRVQKFDDSLEAMNFLNALPTKAKMVAPPWTNKSKQYNVIHYDGDFYAAGMLGQYVYINPAKKLVIVRLGHSWNHPKMYAVQFIQHLADVL